MKIWRDCSGGGRREWGDVGSSEGGREPNQRPEEGEAQMTAVTKTSRVLQGVECYMMWNDRSNRGCLMGHHHDAPIPSYARFMQ